MMTPMENDDELRRIYDTLGSDIMRIIGKSKKLPQFKRRAFVRAFCSLVEFDIYNRKQRALYLYNHGFHCFNISEIVLLLEIQPEVDNKGRVKERPKYIRVVDNYLFAISMFCKVTGIVFQLPFDRPGWSAFKDTIELRNKITHPRSEKDIAISDEQLGMAVLAYKWFMDNYKHIVTLVDQQ
jgi:hypothetical protein